MNGHAALMQEWPKARTKEQALIEWQAAATALEAAKATEAKLRIEVVGLFPFDDEEGTQNIDLANGWKLKAVKKQNYKLDALKVDAALEKMEKLGEAEKLLAERLVKFKPELSISEYRILPANCRGIIDDVLTVSPGMPSLELVPPKG